MLPGTAAPGSALAIVQAIAAGHGGHLELYSELGKGATFVLDLPWFVTADHVPDHYPGHPPEDLPATPDRATPQTGAPA